jgi:hypothetical protein
MDSLFFLIAKVIFLDGKEIKPRPLAQNCLECELYKHLTCAAIGKNVQHPGRKICENQWADEQVPEINESTN